MNVAFTTVRPPPRFFDATKGPRRESRNDLATFCSAAFSIISMVLSLGRDKGVDIEAKRRTQRFCTRIGWDWAIGIRWDCSQHDNEEESGRRGRNGLGTVSRTFLHLNSIASGSKFIQRKKDREKQNKDRRSRNKRGETNSGASPEMIYLLDTLRTIHVLGYQLRAGSERFSRAVFNVDVYDAGLHV